MNTTILKYAGAAAAGVCVGYVTGFLVAKKQLEKQATARIQEEVDSVKAFYMKQAKGDSPSAMMLKIQVNEEEKIRRSNFKDLVEPYSGTDIVSIFNTSELETTEEAFTPPYTDIDPEIPFDPDDLDEDQEVEEDVDTHEEPEPAEDEPVEELMVVEDQPQTFAQRAAAHAAANPQATTTSRNVFTSPVTDDPGEQMDPPNDFRDSSKPYVISIDEFHEENGFPKLSITYFDGDDVLVDDRDQQIKDLDGTVGEINLHRFGQRSKDPNIVYVRNEISQVDFEISRDDATYTESVLGIKPREERRVVRKMREGD